MADELGDFDPSGSDEEMTEDVTPVRERDDFAEGRADAQSSGTKIRGKIKRGNDTRDQDELVIEGRGVNAQEAADDFEQALSRAEDGDWADRLRELQSDE